MNAPPLEKRGVSDVPKEDVPVITPSAPVFETRITENKTSIYNTKTGQFTSIIPDSDREYTPEQRVRLNLELNMVLALRNWTGAGLMNCKRALNACDWDMERAITYLRRKGGFII